MQPIHSEPSKADTQNEHGKAQSPTQTPEAKIPKTDDGARSTEKETQQTKRPRWTDQRWQTVFMGLILFVTGIYASVSFFQWKTMERASSISEQSLKVSEKAYIRVNDIQAD